MAADRERATVPSFRDDRRDTVLKSLTIKLKKGALAEALELQAAPVRPIKATSLHLISMLQSKTVPVALAKLTTLSTGTLEYIDVHVTEPALPHDRIHALFPSFKSWEKETKGHADIMLRDLIHLRREGITTSSLVAHALFETYSQSGITKGTLHIEKDKKKAALALSFFRIANHSRCIEMDRFTSSARYQSLFPLDKLPARLKREQRAAQRTHLTAEVVAYVLAKPKSVNSLLEYMTEHQEPTHRISFDHFNEYAKAQAALRRGAL